MEKQLVIYKAALTWLKSGRLKIWDRVAVVTAVGMRI